MSRIDWATFDCYGTLIDWEGGIAAAIEPLLAGAARLTGHALAERYIAVEAQVEGGAYRSYKEVLAIACRRLCDELGAPLPAGRERALPESVPRWLPFPETAEALRAIRAQGVRIAILSNVDRELLDASIARIGVAPDLIVTAEDARSYKPAPGHWREFLARSGATTAATLHVGASLYHDMIPGAALGFRTVFINRHDEPVAGAAPAAVLRDLRDLPATIARLAREG
jgi:2-haloacid dehalogenase